jgi:hypothetical protein
MQTCSHEHKDVQRLFPQLFSQIQKFPSTLSTIDIDILLMDIDYSQYFRSLCAKMIIYFQFLIDFLFISYLHILQNDCQYRKPES